MYYPCAATEQAGQFSIFYSVHQAKQDRYYSINATEGSSRIPQKLSQMKAAHATTAVHVMHLTKLTGLAILTQLTQLTKLTQLKQLTQPL